MDYHWIVKNKQKQMKIHRFVFNLFQENTYLITDLKGDAIVIDPGFSNEQEFLSFKNYLTKNEITLKAIILTHGHIDHIAGLDFLYSNYQLKPMMHEATMDLISKMAAFGSTYGLPSPKVYQETPYLADGQTLNFGTISCEVRYTPGHADGHIILYFSDQKVVFTGDVLFKESIGRSDLPTGDYDVLKNSILTKLFTLPEETVVYPGHGPETTIAYEKENNPFILF